jgi:hypothetical protein
LTLSPLRLRIIASGPLAGYPTRPGCPLIFYMVKIAHVKMVIVVINFLAVSVYLEFAYLKVHRKREKNETHQVE